MKNITQTFLNILFLCGVAIFLQTTLDAQAQGIAGQESAPHNGNADKTVLQEKMLKTHLIATAPARLIGMYNLSYLHSFTGSLAAGGGLEIPSWYGSTIQGGAGILAEGRIFTDGKGIYGFYAAPYLHFQWLQMRHAETVINPPPDYKVKEYTVTMTPLSTGIMVGWVFLAWEHLACDVALGFKHHIFSNEIVAPSQFIGQTSASNVGFETFVGTLPAIRVNIGYAW